MLSGWTRRILFCILEWKEEKGRHTEVSLKVLLPGMYA